MDKQELERLRATRNKMAVILDTTGECCCNELGGGEAYQCDRCKTLEAWQDLDNMVTPKHEPVARYRDRLSYADGVNAENRLLGMWQAQNKRIPGVNNGRGVLEHILGREPDFLEAEVAASVIQWFGTPVGQCLLREMVAAAEAVNSEQLKALRRIREEQEARIKDEQEA